MSVLDGDTRKSYLLSTIGNYFGIDAKDESIASLATDKQLNTFLDDGNSLLMAASVEKLEGGGGKIHLDNKPHVGVAEDKILIFFKSEPSVVTPENLDRVVLVSSMLDSPVAALYHALQKIYSPLLLQDSKWSTEFDPKLQSLITELERGLGSLMRRQDPSGHHTGEEAPGDAFDALASILTPEDETQYWADVANSGKKKEERDKASAFWNTLEPVSNDFQSMGQMQLQDAEDVLETCQNSLDDLWKLDDWVYPQKRMMHLMDIIANALTRFIQSKCASLDLWTSPYSQVEEALTQGINLCEKWIDICQRLTSLFWKNYPPHLWEGGPYAPAQAGNFQRRLREIHSLRTLHKQLTQLLSNAEQEELKTSQSFEPFKDIHPMQYNPYTEPAWQAAVTSYENALVPAENRIAGKLKQQLRNMNANTLQFLQEFKRYQELIRRPSIQRELIVEREKLLGKLSEYISTERKGYREVGEVRSIHGVPPTLNSIYFIRQLDAKIKDIMKTGGLLLADLNSWPQLKSEAEDTISEMSEYQKELFDNWTRDNLQDIESKNLSLLTSSQVVYFEQGRDMKVSYNPRLVGLSSETRLLQMLGFSVPKKIVDVAEQAKKFGQQAKLLEQIATFHNTIGDRMITSQRPMMLEAAFGLASLVKQQTDMTWEHVGQVESYISKLQQHVYKLARQNNALALRHKNVKEKLFELMNTDLLRKQGKWKDTLKEIRLIMTDVEQDGFTNLTTWRRHWDHQLYKALEHQYQVGLEALNEHLPEIKVELIYRQQSLQFRPPIEEIRMKYFVQLKRFLAIPNNFKGVGETAGEKLIFPTIVERNAHRFSHLFKKAEDLFGRLDKVKEKFIDWVALGSVDIEDYIKENLIKPEDWESNFRASKSKGQEIGRLPSGEEKIDCISVSFAPIRNEIEILNRKYWDTLVAMLQRSIVQDIDDIEKYATEAMESLRTQPQTVEEIGEANQRHNHFNEQTPKMLEKFHRADSKNKVLAQWTKEHLDSINRVTGLWDNYMSLMENHELVISKQVEAIKANLNTQVSNANGEIEKFKMRWDQLKPKEDSMEGDGAKILVGLKIIKEKRQEWDALVETRTKIKSDCEHFGLKEPEFPKYDDVENDLAKHEEMWGLFEEFNTALRDMSKEEWIIFRSKSFKFEEFLAYWYDKLQNTTNATTVTVKLLQEVERYRVVLPVLKYVRGDIFSETHWNEMYALLAMQRKPVDKLLFEDFLAVRERLVANENELKELNNRALGEVAIRQALSELDVWEVEAKLSFLEHEASSGEKVPLIKDWKDLLNKVGDNQVLLQSIKGSPYYQSFGDRAVMWEQRLTDLDEILNSLNTAQRKWVYLEPYQEQMKMKSAAQTGGFDYREVFRKIDDDFRMIMTDAKRDNRVVSLLRIGSIKSILEHMLERLERCQKSLNEFLEEKRSSFPRFYFIGDDDLLQILGQATKPAIIQTHLKKLFAGIYNVNFDKEEKHIITMNSLEGEIVPLKNEIRISNEVEAWLSALAKEMKDTLRQLLTDCLYEGRRSNSGVDPLKYPSQILCLAEEILFTERCEEALSTGKLETYLSDLEAQLESYTSVDMEDGSGDSKVLELKLKALIFDIIHHIDIVKLLEQESCKSKEDWLWQKQLRYYMAENGFAEIAMVDATFAYTYEYQGNAQRLVHTPLTDKCFLTLTQGMRVGLGGNPYGPAGTGKTESVKALGGLFGRQVLVFNCDEGIDVKSMGRIFIGLVKCGAWGCFDEFNRLEEQTLSAVSMQIQPIQAALKGKDKLVTLLDKTVDMDPNTGIFVTMNPAGKGYGGRQKLPDNLKQLFRPVAMSKPDIDLISEVSLYSEGFKNAKQLGHKLVNIFTLSKSLLTPQQHYDWNLRALKTVLKGCGNMLKMARSDMDKSMIDAAKEAEIIVQALRLNTLSKLTFTDSIRFDSLVKDVFPGVTFNNAGYEELKVAIRESCVELNLNVNENQVKKAIELYEQLQQRMGVVIVGPSGSGKTTLFKILKHALTKMGQNVKQHTMNPKAIPRHQLLGSIDLDTREWTNGVLTLAALQAVDEPATVNTWVVCDGDIDPEWVESLNSVLDDNRLLTLPSGWRIQFGPNVNFIFETHDLAFASPATISRVGMIFLSDEDTDVKGLVSAWLGSQPENVQEVLPRYIEEYFFKAIDWCQKASDYVVETSLVGCVLNGLSHMHGVTSRMEFAVALIMGLGGNLKESSRDSFAKDVYKWVGESPPGRKPMATFYNKERDRVDAFTSDVENKLSLNDFNEDGFPLVKTSDVKAALACIMPWLQAETQQPFLLIGPEGCGKGLILSNCFKKLRATNVATIHCSAHITPQHVIQKLSQVCLVVSSSNGRVFRPKECDRLILYLKDLNLASPDKYGTCMLIAFLQQILTYGGFYDNNLEWVGLEAIQLVGSLTAGTGLGRHALNTRFTSILRLYSLVQPDKEYLEVVYTSYLSAVLRETVPNHSTWSSESKVAQLAASMVKLFNELKQNFSVDDQSHYLFTPRDLTEWTLGLVRYDIDAEDNSPNTILEIWAYEACRLFRDKLASDADIDKFDSLLKGLMHSEWSSSAGDKMDSTYFVTEGVSGTVPGAPLPKFGRSLGTLEVEDWEATVEKGAVLFGRENRDLNIAVTQELLQLVAGCDRVLCRPGGSMLMIGQSGVGRRAAASITCALHHGKMITLKMGRNYGVKQFKTEIKAAMQVAGVDGDQVFLMLEDHNFGDPEYLDIINSLLSAGEVPGLYSPEELEPLMITLREKANNEGFSGNLFSFFAQCVYRNLHVVLIMDHGHPSFVQNCESNPALYKQCQVVWLDQWSAETMTKLPLLLLTQEERVEGGDIGGGKKEKKKHVSGGQELLQNFLKIHSSLPRAQGTPQKYVDFIRTYDKVYSKEKTEITSRQIKLSTGVSKLQEAREVVHKLKKEAGVQEKELAEKQHEANEALQMITDTMRNANSQKDEMENLKGQALKEEKTIVERKKIIEVEMAEIGPLVEEAKKAVGNIKASTLSEIRSLRAPPDVIRDILEGVLRLMGTKDASWNSMKSFLAKRGIKDEILQFDARKIHSKDRQIVEKLLEDRHNSFDPDVAKRASGAAAPLASWVLANVKFSYVLEKVKPLEAEQAKLQRNLKNAEDQLTGLSTGLDEVDQQVAVLKDRLNKFTKEAAAVEIHLNKTKETIAAADSLVEGLEGEYNRWNTEVENMSEGLEKIPHYSLLGAAFLVYLSNAPEDQRKVYMDRWQHMVGVSKFDLNHFLSSERQILQWRSEGLPSDNLSVENAMCILQNIASPYLIDPSSRASDWLKNHLKEGASEKEVEITTQSDDRFVLTLELAVRFGKTLFIQDVNQIDPILYPILRKDLVGQGPYKAVQVGDKQVDFNVNFKLFMATRNAVPDIPPDARAIISTVNFTTTRAGLTGQLLMAALQHEKPELEERKSELLKQEEENKIEISKLEDFLLEQLASSTGNILENKELLSSLNTTKDKSASIAQALEESSSLAESLEAEGNAYLPLAEFASRMFFTISDLKKLNNMYRTSLASFMRIYQETLSDSSNSGASGEKRIENLKHSLQVKVFHHISRGLFKDDRLTYAMQFVHGMYPDMCGQGEWDAFLGLLVKGGGEGASGGSAPGWVSDDTKQHVLRLKLNFPDLFRDLQLDDANIWAGFANAEECEVDFPVQIVKRMSPFQQVLVVQASRPDRLVSAMEHFVSRALQLKELAPPALSLKNMYKETLNSEPILILVSSGADPSEELRELAGAMSQQLQEVAMGQGQSEIAITKLKAAAEGGHWVCLKNLHLMTFWIPTLEKELAKLQPHDRFRIWLTAESHQKFSPILTESCLKVTYESPPGIKRNLQRTLLAWGNDVIERERNNIHRSQSIFALAWFHAVVQERRTFIPQGWCKFYEFSDADLKAGLEAMEQLYKTGEMRWEFVHGLYENAIYGGRVDDQNDIKILESYLREVFNPDTIAGNNRANKKLGPFDIPASTDFNEFFDLINKMSDDDKPAMFGLPANIERSHQRMMSGASIVQLKLLQRSATVGGKFERDKWNKELSPVLNLWKKLNSGSELLQVKLYPPTSGDGDPMRAFVELEFFNAVSLLQHVHKALSGLSKVIRGTSLLDDKVTKLAESLMNQETPPKWMKMWSGPEDPMEYIHVIVDKSEQVYKWKSMNESLLESELHLSDLFHPDTFLGALRQVTARKYDMAMDELRLVNTWGRTPVPNAQLAIRVEGLMIEGALFDGKSLSPNLHDSPTNSPVTTCNLAWVPDKGGAADVYDESTHIKLPLYYSSERENIIGFLEFPSGGKKDVWLQAGVVLFMNSHI